MAVELGLCFALKDHRARGQDASWLCQGPVGMRCLPDAGCLRASWTWCSRVTGTAALSPASKGCPSSPHLHKRA